MPDLKVIEIDACQAETVQQLAFATWYDAYCSILAKQQIEYMLEKMYSLHTLENQFQAGHHFFIVSDYDDKPLGFISCETDLNAEKVCKIHKLYVLPQCRHLGCGALLLSTAEKMAHDAGNSRVLLNVNRQNPAVAFYHHLGYRILCEEDIDIGDGYWMNDYVMQKTITIE